LIFVGCSSQSKNPEFEQNPIVFIDALGREVNLEKHPEKIVIAGKQTPMLANYFYLFPDVHQKIIAIENRSQNNEQFLEIVEPSYREKLVLEKSANVEQIAPFEPDLVVLKTTMQEELGENLEKIGIPVAYVSFEGVEEIYSNISTIGEIVDQTITSQEIIAKYEQIYDETTKKIENNNGNMSILLLQIVGEGDDTSFLTPAGSWLQTSMVELANGIPVWKDVSETSGWMDVNIEQILLWDPEVIIVINYQGKGTTIVENLKQESIWSAMRAVENDQIYAFPNDYISWDQPDTRWVLGYVWLSYIINPESFSIGFFEDKVREFYGDFYGVSQELIEELIIPKIFP